MNKEKMQDIKERLDLFPSNMNEPAQKAYCELFDYIANLEQQCKKQKEVIDKITNAIQGDIEGFRTINEHGESTEILELLEIYIDVLKEVSE